MNETTKTATEEKPVFINDFFKLDDLPVKERTTIFSGYFRQQIAEGLPVFREVLSPADNRITITDNVTGEPHETVMFGSNNYLGLANHPALKEKIEAYLSECGIGLGGPPLLNGSTRLHKKLEKRLAELKGSEASLLYSSGFGANYGMITALVGKNDALILDELSHASIMDGTKNSRGKQYFFAHNNMVELEKSLLKAEADGKTSKFVVVEGVYSMNGDIAPLDKVYEISKKHGAVLIVDDAHGTGIMGKNGRGTAELFDLEGKIDITMGTFSKALASSGGFITASRDIVDYLRFFSRPYFFSASMPPILIAHIMASLDVMEEYPELRDDLYANVDYMLNGLQDSGYDVSSDSAIIPIHVPASVNIRKLARQVDEAGVFVNHIEYPAVASDKQRFRISVMASHTKEDMDILIDLFRTIRPELLNEETEEVC